MQENVLLQKQEGHFFQNPKSIYDIESAVTIQEKLLMQKQEKALFFFLFTR